MGSPPSRLLPTDIEKSTFLLEAMVWGPGSPSLVVARSQSILRGQYIGLGMFWSNRIRLRTNKFFRTASGNMIYIEHTTDFEFYSATSKGAIQGYGYQFAESTELHFLLVIG